MTLYPTFSVGIRSPSTSWTEIPLGKYKQLRNSRLLRSSIGFPRYGHSELTVVHPLFPPCRASLDEAVSLFVGILEHWVKSNLHGPTPTIKKQTPGLTTPRAAPQEIPLGNTLDSVASQIKNSNSNDQFLTLAKDWPPTTYKPTKWRHTPSKLNWASKRRNNQNKP